MPQVNVAPSEWSYLVEVPSFVTSGTRGRVPILDMIPNNDRTGPLFPLMFALNMLVNSDEGSTYTLAEYTRWLNEAGFGRVETGEIGSHSPAIVATRD